MVRFLESGEKRDRWKIYDPVSLPIEGTTSGKQTLELCSAIGGIRPS